MKEPPEGMLGVEIVVSAADADDARRIIDEYRTRAASAETQAQLPEDET